MLYCLYDQKYYKILLPVFWILSFQFYIHCNNILKTSILQEKLKLVTVFGAGLLVGTALAVIIPEGIHAMYSVGH
jgi:zinc transporter 9